MTKNDEDQAVIADVNRRTGRTFLHIGGIPTQDATTARLTLPILAEWPELVANPDVRCAIYAKFNTRHATPYVGKLVKWFSTETHPLSQSLLSQAIGMALSAAEAEYVFSQLPSLPNPDEHVWILVKLAGLKPTAAKAKVILTDMLFQGKYRRWHIQLLSQVNDARIQDWFVAHADDPDPFIRRYAKRVVNRGRKLPPALVRAAGRPFPTPELFSTEIDDHELPDLLSDLAQQYRFRVPAGLKSGEFLARLERDAWVRANIKAHDKPCWLWFRSEDVDTVEVAITEAESLPESKIVIQ